jgi:hypothetical protein
MWRAGAMTTPARRTWADTTSEKTPRPRQKAAPRGSLRVLGNDNDRQEEQYQPR